MSGLTPQWTSTSVDDHRWRTTTTAANNGGGGGRNIINRRKSSARSVNNTRSNNNNNNSNGRGYYVEDYGEQQEDESNKRGGYFSCLLNAWRWCKYNCTAALICFLGVVSSIISATIISTTLVQVASSLSIILSLLVMWQRRKIRKLGTLRGKNNELRGHVRYFRQERERLHRTLDRLDETSAELHSVPHELHRLNKKHHGNLDRLVDVVKQQQDIQYQMREKINQQIMQQILEIVMGEDRDKDWTLRPTEIEKLIVRLGLNPHVEIDEVKFRQMLLMAPNVSTIMQLIRALLERDDEYEHNDSVFKIKFMDINNKNNTISTIVKNIDDVNDNDGNVVME